VREIRSFASGGDLPVHLKAFVCLEEWIGDDFSSSLLSKGIGVSRAV